MIYGDESLGEACRGAIFDEMGALGGDGGIVALDRNGKIALVCNSAGMFRAWATPTDSGVAMFGATQEGTVEVY
jgi:beta-aspartyl-peptidase (threonine type)